MLTPTDLKAIENMLAPRFAKIDLELGVIKKSVNKLEKNFEVMLGFLDRQDVELKKRVIRIEEHLHLSAN